MALDPGPFHIIPLPVLKPHTHLPADGQKMSMKGLLALGITGGIIPCPTALVVLLAAIAYHRVAPSD